MTDFNFESEEVKNPEIVSEFSMENYQKYRLKSGNLTLDLAIVGLENRNTADYIGQRKNEISHSETKVPHPYKAEEQSGDPGEELVDFNGKTGRGSADPEYNLVPEDGGQIPRYDYLIKWLEPESEDRLVEIEIYSPKGDYSESKLMEIINSFRMEI